ncbi:Oxysterol-binding protein-related protein 1 [Oopsacas minuta]|uniref:Oxysterol-binding protein-related protein 1 n=1 Tax=Oopsacas minuta TaxID=111878 RepID=A0AAV7JG56_9METZ|nr:Oxysterol-binding protein-related protein 1 [Oopsacas minuta]
MNFENLEHRVVIKFLCIKGLSATETFKEMKDVLKDNAPSQSMVAKWHAEFERGRESITENDHCISIRNIANRVDLSIGTIHSIIHHYLGHKKYKANWIPKTLSEDQMKARLEPSKSMIDLYMSDPDDFHARLITRDELGYTTMTPALLARLRNGGMKILHNPKYPTWSLSKV